MMKLTHEQASCIYDVLVADCEARHTEADGFINYVTSENHSHEWRFMGTLGFGGKFRTSSHYERDGLTLVEVAEATISCYPEDSTPERKELIARVNKKLAAILTPPSTLTEVQEAALRQIEANVLIDIAAGYTREEARLRRRDALLALNLESEDESEFGL